MPADRDADAATEDSWLEELGKLEDPSRVRRFFGDRPQLHDRAGVQRLTQEILRHARQDLPLAERLSAAAEQLAELAGDDYGRALALKARGHLRFLLGRYEEALALYRSCQERFRAAGAEIEAASNLGSSMWMLALLGRYEAAWRDSRAARRVLEAHGDPLLLARLITNEANVFLRQDRHLDALERYKSALELFRESGEAQDVAVTLHNIAVSSIAVSDFQQSLDSYRELGAHCREHRLPLLAAQAEYNIAYLYFFRGEYARAIKIYQETRKHCEELGDSYHLALCDLDQAEIYLELNLSSEAARLAARAFDAFDARANGYEAAKALTFLALAASQKGDTVEALERFSVARERFEAEGNRAWVGMVDFYRALIFSLRLDTRRARKVCGNARDFFANVPWPSRVALCDLLLAQVDLLEGRPSSARERCLESVGRLEALDLPSLALKAFFVLGRAEEALGDRAAAVDAYRSAHDLLRDLRTHLASEESKIAFLRDKLEIYESLVAITLDKAKSTADLEDAFMYIEEAKSRILADLVASGGSSLEASPGESSELVDEMKRLREELSFHHHELAELQGFRTGAEGSPELPSDGGDGALPDTDQLDRNRVKALELRSRECEQRLLQAMSALRARESQYAALQSAETTSLESIRESLPPEMSLLEYFQARGTVYACVLGPRRIDIRPVAQVSDLRGHLDLLHMQIDKYQLGEEYMARFGTTVEKTLDRLLEKLYRKLVEPIADRLAGDQLVIVPHGLLHQVPFHALHDGEQFLLDRFAVSYSPSASLHHTLSKRPARGLEPSLVLGIPDARAPEISVEIDAVTRALPDARVFVGEAATEERLRELGPSSRYVHIATHGFFRRDNPMFSSVQLGNSRLTVLDLYNLELNSDLVVLSGCSTGRHSVETGDELIGLTRGLLYAGASAVLVSLWDVHDKSTATFMAALYRHLASEPNRARALGRAMKDLRSEHASPYYWAPFVLIGKPETTPGGDGLRPSAS